MHPRVKICCISSTEEAHLAIRLGASAIGLVSRMPSGPGPIPDARIREIAATVPPPIATFLLTSEISAAGVIDHHKKVHTNTIQLVDKLKPGAHEDIRAALPNVKLVQVIHVLDTHSIAEAIQLAPKVDALLLDSGNPHLEVKELGGTGRTHDWNISKKIRKAVPIPVFLAGGLTPENVRQAIEQVQPFGVDICSGIRTGGSLDPHKLEAFFNAIYS